VGLGDFRQDCVRGGAVPVISTARGSRTYGEEVQQKGAMPKGIQWHWGVARGSARVGKQGGHGLTLGCNRPDGIDCECR
jgi:hypothetical protein